ncbi:S-adenosyl-L-methionine-dependent methyltransferase [Dacryopinax primogenitus]|uniref:Leucine carboxyl methyltransferase 1 n=1 Tax=Dacryopinax primogenitus (strain DJM 731) TaxID=1858805 RepID=M5FQC7_DACPD|nr:S-adenosyl-L-methionine-dependent methyltransferase [Dacryopinax primogenitus]EJT96894.1 S-adenosyl-L-methionine-dependent methyltransferase [Dacryopinax primogenitus]
MFPPPSRPPFPSHSAPIDQDTATRSTDTDALHARLSASRLSYFPDPFVESFVLRAQGVPNRPALINVGTWLRGRSVDALVKGFVQRVGEGGKVQVLSLGAGSDTRFWRISSTPMGGKIARWVEVDFPEVTSSKARAIWKHAQLKGALGVCALTGGGTGVRGEKYALLPADLRLSPEKTLGALLTPANDTDALLSPTLPTLVLLECVLPYLPLREGETVLRWAGERFGKVAVVLYEMFGLGDAFGKVMRENLAVRGVQIPGTVASLDALNERFQRAGFEGQALTLRDIRTHYVPPAENERVAKLELMDEYEELDLVLGHYAVAWGSKGVTGWGMSRAEEEI